MNVRACLLAVAVSTLNAAPNPEDIIRKSVEAIQFDWAQTPKYSYLERDVESKRHSPATAKTYRVLMIEGSPYNLVTAINDEPLSADDRAAEQRKLEKEIQKKAKRVRTGTAAPHCQISEGEQPRSCDAPGNGGGIRISPGGPDAG